MQRYRVHCVKADTGKPYQITVSADGAAMAKQRAADTGHIAGKVEALPREDAIDAKLIDPLSAGSQARQGRGAEAYMLAQQQQLIDEQRRAAAKQARLMSRIYEAVVLFIALALCVFLPVVGLPLLAVLIIIGVGRLLWRLISAPVKIGLKVAGR